MHGKENYCLSFDSVSLIKIRSHHFCKQKATNLFVLFGKGYSLKFYPVFIFMTLGGALNLSLNQIDDIFVDLGSMCFERFIIFVLAPLNLTSLLITLLIFCILKSHLSKQ